MQQPVFITNDRRFFFDQLVYLASRPPRQILFLFFYIFKMNTLVALCARPLGMGLAALLLTFVVTAAMKSPRSEPSALASDIVRKCLFSLCLRLPRSIPLSLVRPFKLPLPRGRWAHPTPHIPYHSDRPPCPRSRRISSWGSLLLVYPCLDHFPLTSLARSQHIPLRKLASVKK